MRNTNTTSNHTYFRDKDIIITDTFIEKKGYRYLAAEIKSVERKILPAQRGIGLGILFLGLFISSCSIGANIFLNMLMTGAASGSSSNGSGFAIFPPVLLPLALSFLLLVVGFVLFIIPRKIFAIEIKGSDIDVYHQIMLKSRDKTKVNAIFNAISSSIEHNYTVTRVKTDAVITTITIQEARVGGQEIHFNGNPSIVGSVLGGGTVSGNTINITDSLKISTTPTQQEIIDAMRQLRAEIDKAVDLPGDDADDLKSNIDAAIKSTNREEPNKTRIIEKLDTMQGILDKLKGSFASALSLGTLLGELMLAVKGIHV